MKINQIEIYPSPIKLKEPFIISLGSHEYAENIIVVIKTDNGLSGYGECCPFKTINGESMESGCVVGKYLAQNLLGKNPLDIAECSSVMDATIYGNSSIKSAFDIALYDIAAQNAQLPLYAFLKGNKNKTILTDYTISIDSADKMAADAKKIIANGFQFIKVKLGGSKEQDVERIKKIREAVGVTIPLRIDANQGWKAEEALDILTALAPYKIQHCEEPIPRWDFMHLPKIKKASPISIMADESCCDHHDAKRLIDLSACDQINVKLGKASGIFKSLKIIQLAEAANMKMQIGGFLESRLAFTASAHLALSSANVVHIDFDSPLMLKEDHVIGGISYGPNGEITVPEQIGLGASVDENYLNTLQKTVIK
ncbi:MAG: dipeptide epimerase [Bacteroidetes bacterium]|nr:dipeptide epimerase [Bacteroidota bacterium]